MGRGWRGPFNGKLNFQILCQLINVRNVMHRDMEHGEFIPHRIHRKLFDLKY